MSTARFTFQTEVIDGLIYAISGLNPDYVSSIEVYDPDTDTWTVLASMAQGRRDFQTEVIDSRIYAIGGVGESNSCKSSLEVYDTVTDSWTSLASMTTGRYYHGIGVINGKIYAFGGFGYTEIESSVEVYDPDINTWTTVTSMPVAKSLFGTTIIDDKIYVVGGRNTSGSDPTYFESSFEVYDPNIDTWTALSPMTTARQLAEVQVLNGKLYAIGGNNTDSLSLVERYTVASTSTGVPASPANLTATAGDAQVGLSWDAVSGATSYTVMRATASGGPYTAIAAGVTGTSYTDTDVTNGTTYYYVVIAVNGDGDSEYSNEASATPAAAIPTYSALLRITMVTGEIKEYEMDGADIEAFISWCDSEGTGSPSYLIVKDYNLGPFSTREEYIVYDKIVSFEVLTY